jgi:hypothetical protein
MPAMAYSPRIGRPIVVLLITALVSVPTAGLAQEMATDKPAAAQTHGNQTRLATALRAAAADPGISLAPDEKDQNESTCSCKASVAEKLAWLYALIGGSVMLITGPQEKEGDKWTVDGKSETVAGAAAIVLSFALLKDIRKKRATVHQP